MTCRSCLPSSTTDVAVTATLTSVQYAKMARWARGEFAADWTGAEPLPIPYDDLPVAERPNALDRAPLEASVGAGRFPGIEAGQIMLDPATYEPARPFRVNQNKPPGTLTEHMAVPWQADFRDCEFQEDIGMDWWPGQRPCDVYRMVNGEITRVPWVPQTGEWTAREVQPFGDAEKLVSAWICSADGCEGRGNVRGARADAEGLTQLRSREEAARLLIGLNGTVDVGIVGGGVGGCAAAIALAREGRSVVVFERGEYAAHTYRRNAAAARPRAARGAGRLAAVW